ncbi:tetratricopeptide repeat protein [bacterium]|nr:tetratricopeptide repeat protein [candidate division CSSED10-310 bacterium]
MIRWICENVLAFILPAGLAAVFGFTVRTATGILPESLDRAWHVTGAAFCEIRHDHDGVIRNLATVLRNRDRVPEAVRSWHDESMRRSGMQKLMEGDFAGAAARFGQYLERHPRHYLVTVNRGIALQKLGDVESARSLFTRAVELIPENHDAYLARGHLALFTDRLEEARPDYERALERSGRLGPVRVDIGDAFRLAGDWETASTFYRAGSAMDPMDPFSLVRMAETALYLDGDRFRAREYLDLAVNLIPGWESVLLLKERIGTWSPGDARPYVPLVVIPPGPIESWEMQPSRLLVEWQRPEWRGYADHR